MGVGGGGAGVGCSSAALIFFLFSRKARPSPPSSPSTSVSGALFSQRAVAAAPATSCRVWPRPAVAHLGPPTPALARQPDRSAGHRKATSCTRPARRRTVLPMWQPPPAPPAVPMHDSGRSTVLRSASPRGPLAGPAGQRRDAAWRPRGQRPRYVSAGFSRSVSLTRGSLATKENTQFLSVLACYAYAYRSWNHSICCWPSWRSRAGGAIAMGSAAPHPRATTKEAPPLGARPPALFGQDFFPRRLLASPPSPCLADPPTCLSYRVSGWSIGWREVTAPPLASNFLPWPFPLVRVGCVAGGGCPPLPHGPPTAAAAWLGTRGGTPLPPRPAPACLAHHWGHRV